MRIFSVKFTILAIGMLFTTLSHGRSSHVWRWYSDQQITFPYPTFIYDAPVSQSERATEEYKIFEVIDIKKKHTDSVDAVTVCKDEIKKCASMEGFDKPYWLEEASGRLIVFNPTEIAMSYKNNFGAGYEVFPLCEWVDSHGISSQYGGQCYVILVSNGKKTISFNFLLGENVGVRLLHKRYQKQIDMYRRIAESAR
jgi:hypothetical protein